jgi:hypothetical protein
MTKIFLPFFLLSLFLLVQSSPAQVQVAATLLDAKGKTVTTLGEGDFANPKPFKIKITPAGTYKPSWQVVLMRGSREVAVYNGTGDLVPMATLTYRPKEGDRLEVIITKVMRKRKNTIEEITLPGQTKFAFGIKK